MWAAKKRLGDFFAAIVRLVNQCIFIISVAHKETPSKIHKIIYICDLTSINLVSVVSKAYTSRLFSGWRWSKKSSLFLEKTVKSSPYDKNTIFWLAKFILPQCFKRQKVSEYTNVNLPKPFISIERTNYFQLNWRSQNKKIKLR